MSNTTILFFGRIADEMGRERKIDLPADGCTVAELRQLIGGMAVQASIRVAVNQAMAGETDGVSPGQEVAFLSPLSGG